MRSPGNIYSRQQILKHVWAIDFDPETNVVDVCVLRIKRKLNRKNGSPTSPIESVRGVGYGRNSRFIAYALGGTPQNRVHRRKKNDLDRRCYSKLSFLERVRHCLHNRFGQVP
jgi:DNA-binding winged helix-turn-helix (wHTH) protein